MKTKQINKKLFLISLVFLAGTSFLAQADPPTGDWTLIWSDEFDSGSTPEYPNSANWGYESGYVRNEEWQYYTNELQNAYCQDGFLHIEAHKHPAGTYPTGSYSGQDGSISSASLVSWGKVTNQYGWLEMRGRIDTQQGSWPAFWTLGVNGDWPDNGECDIMEWYQDYLHFNVAWWKTGDPAWTARWDSVTSYAPTLNDFHTWAMQWTAQEVRLYMDGVLYNTWDSSQDSGDSSIEGFQQPHYIILNQAIGGTAGGNASGIAYPTNYEVDYVRWYQDLTNYVDDGDGSITYNGTWGTWSGNPGYMETEHYSETAGSEATFTFTGDQVWYYGFKRNDLGYADILLDGQPVASVDCYSSTSEYFTCLYESPQLTFGTHTLTIRVAGVQNPASSGTEVIVDAFGYSGAPAAPANLRAFTGDGNIVLNWADNDELDLSGYNVYRSTVSGGPYSPVATDVASSDYVDNTVTNETTYYYVVTAVNTSSYESVASNEASATPALLLSQGQPVTASSYESGNEPFDGNDGSLSTRWTAVDSSYPQWWRVDLGSVKPIGQAVIYWYGDTARSYKYQIEISDDDVNYTTLVDQTARTETGTSADVFSALARYVRVTVTGSSAGWAGFWDCQLFGMVEDTTPPAAPTGLAATAGDSSVSLDWDDNSEPDFDSYIVYRSITSGSGYASIATGIASSDYVDNTVSNGTTYYYVVTAVDFSSNESGYSNEASATPDAVAPVDHYANGETTISGTVSGSYADTTASDNVYEAITEIESGGKPSKRHSLLEHTWTINIGAGDNPILMVEAYHTANSEGDDFVFGYSTDNVNFTDVVTVSKTSDDNIAQGAALPGSLTGTVYIRVTDTDSTQGNRTLDTVYVDELYIETSGGGGPNNPPSFNSDPIVEINGIEGQSYSSTISDDASDPDFDTLTFSKVAGPAWLVVAANGDLSGTPGAGDVGLNSFTVEVDDGNGGTDQATLEITVDPAGSEQDMYVNDIAMGSRSAGPNYFGQATVWIKDDSGANVEGAVVYGNWSGATSESVSGTTLADGTVFFESSKVRNGGTFTFTVTDVVKSGFIYNAALNVETSDSITAP